jgi:hypothetical protein
MPNVVTITRPDVIALIEKAAKSWLAATSQRRSLWRCDGCWTRTPGRNLCSRLPRGSVRIREGVDLIAPTLDVQPEADTDLEIRQ